MAAEDKDLDSPENTADYPGDFGARLFQKLSERQLNRIQGGGSIERIFSRKEIEQAFLETFDLVGGVPRLAIWANHPDNYHHFLQLMAKLFPKGIEEKGGKVLNYHSNVPYSPLSETPLPPPSGAGQVYENE